MTRIDCIKMYEKISKRILIKIILARKFWNEGNHKEAIKMGDYIKRLAEVRLRYLYQ